MSNYAEQFNAAFGDLFAEVTKAIDELAARDGLAAKSTEKLEQELQSTKDLVKKLQAENAVLRSENASLLKLRTADFDQIQRLALENDTQQAKIHTLTGQLLEAGKKVEARDSRINRYWKQLTAAQNQRDSYKKNVEVLKAREGDLYAQIDQLSKALAASSGEIQPPPNTTCIRIPNLEDITIAIGDYSIPAADIPKLQKTGAEYFNRCTTLEKRVAALKQTIEELRTQARAQDEEIRLLRADKAAAMQTAPITVSTPFGAMPVTPESIYKLSTAYSNLDRQLHDAAKKLTTLETPLGPMLPTPENFMKLNDALYAKEGELQVIGASFNSYLDAMLKVFDITSHKPQG